ncbi:MAG: hypothetical protein AAF385_12280, partial [Pseudomonadota bacterium]
MSRIVRIYRLRVAFGEWLAYNLCIHLVAAAALMSDPVFDSKFLRAPQTVGTAVDALESGFAEQSLSYGHGAVCARDEAAWLIFHVANLA